MERGGVSARTRAVQVGLAAVLGLAAGLLLVARDGPESNVRPAEAVSVVGSVTPSLHVFGDPVEARVEVVVDSATVDPASVRVDPEFAPYELAGRARVERIQVGDVGVVRFTYRLLCHKEGCDASGARGVVALPSARVLYHFREGTGNAVAPLDWPSFEVISRATDVDVDRIRWEAAEVTLPPVSHRFDATALAVVLLVLAALAVGLAAWLVRRAWRTPASAIAVSGGMTARPPRLERAFVQARSAATNGDSGRRRRALERVALELTALGQYELADEARSLAWSPREATDDDVDTLAARAEVT